MQRTALRAAADAWSFGGQPQPQARSNRPTELTRVEADPGVVVDLFDRVEEAGVLCCPERVQSVRYVLVRNMREWKSEAEEAIRMCEAWAASVVTPTPCRLFLFGSAIYKKGEQFDREQSDLDIVCLLAGPNSALLRWNTLRALFGFKADLELQMIRTLSRSTCIEPGVSVVTINDPEVRANIHKSGASGFFSKNFFYDLVDKREMHGLPLAGTRTMSDERRQALQYVQKVRNEYLSVCANGSGGITEFNGSDPMPKPLLRAAAQLSTEAAEGEWYDTRLGLELMYSALQERRKEGDIFRTLFDRISVRRGGRGTKTALSAEDQLLLAEILFDLAVAGDTDDIGVGGPAASPPAVDFFAKLNDFLWWCDHDPVVGIAMAVDALEHEIQKMASTIATPDSMPHATPVTELEGAAVIDEHLAAAIRERIRRRNIAVHDAKMNVQPGEARMEVHETEWIMQKLRGAKRG